MRTSKLGRIKVLLPAGVVVLLAACGGDDSNTPDNTAPALVTTAFPTTEDTLLAAQLVATDADSDPLTFTRVVDVQHGALTMSAAGAVTYTPSADYSGTDSFRVQVTDGAGGDTTATVTITITAVNDLPRLVATQFSILEDNRLQTQLQGVDPEGDAFTFETVSGPQKGVATVSSAGELRYDPNREVNGSDSLYVRLVESGGAADAAQKIDITIQPGNDAPIALNDAVRVQAGGPVQFSVTGNDVEFDGDALRVTVPLQPKGGTITVDANNVLTFTPENDFEGPTDFSYQLADVVGGASSDADVRLLVGEPQSMLILADTGTVDLPSLHLFDGLTRRQVARPPPYENYKITRFALSGDGATLAYMFSGPHSDEIYVKTLDGAVAGTLIYRTPFNTGQPVGTPVLQLNYDGSLAAFEDRYSTGPKRTLIARTSSVGGSGSLLGNADPDVVQTTLVTFNPFDNDQVVVRGQRGGTWPPDGVAEFYTMYVGGDFLLNNLVQAGSDYPQANGSGSGNGFQFGANGRYIYHGELLQGPPQTRSLLVYDNQTQTENVMFRRPQATERGTSPWFDANANGTRVCFSFGEPGGSSVDGPSRYYVGSGDDPAGAYPVSPVYPVVGRCTFASDNDLVVMQPNTASGNRQEVFSVSASAPGTPLKLSRDLASNEEMGPVWVARGAMRIVVGYHDTASQLTDLFTVPLSGVGPVIPMATAFDVDGGTMQFELNDEGTLLAYTRPLGSATGLFLTSTQTLNHSVSLGLQNPVHGVLQYQWIPRP